MIIEIASQLIEMRAVDPYHEKILSHLDKKHFMWTCFLTWWQTLVEYI